MAAFTPAQKSRMFGGGSGESAWRWIVSAQRSHFDAAVAHPLFIQTIEERMGL